MADLVVDRSIGDLAINLSGELLTLTGRAALQRAITRRLATALGGYGRFVLIEGNFVEIDGSYGSDLRSYLGTPQSFTLSEESKTTIIESLSLEPRVSVQDIKIIQDGGKLGIALTYRSVNFTDTVTVAL